MAHSIITHSIISDPSAEPVHLFFNSEVLLHIGKQRKYSGMYKGCILHTG